MDPHKKVIMGKLASPYGIRGQIKVISFTSPIETLLSYQPWFIYHDHAWKSFSLTAGKVHGKFLLASFPTIENPEAAREYLHAFVAINYQSLPALDQNEYYWADLIGLSVCNLHGDPLGKVTSLLETPAHDVLLVTHNAYERFIPYTTHTIHAIHLDRREIIVDWEPDF